jgi:hypothetical protein
MYQAEFPVNVSGTVYIRVVDTDRTQGNSSLDPVYVDYMYIESGGTPPPPDTIYVADIAVGSVEDRGNKIRGQASVTVVDQDSQPVVGALVEGDFSGPSSDSQSGTTGNDGIAVIQSERVRNPLGLWCFTVDNIVFGADIYDDTRNVETTDCEGSGKLASDSPDDRLFARNYPNPFNPTTEIQINLPEAAGVKLDIFNIVGQRIATLVEDRLDAGHHTFTWDGTGYPSGVYFYHLKAGNATEIRKMLLLK